MLRLLLIALLTCASPALADPGPATSAFRVGTGVACGIAGPGTVVCSGTRSGSMSIRDIGTPASTSMRVRATAATPRLRGTWRKAGVTCRARGAEVTCTNRSGAVLVLSANRVVVLAGDSGAAVSP